MKQEDGTYTRDVPTGAWVGANEAGVPERTYEGMVVGFDESDGQYWVMFLEDANDPNSEWSHEWSDHEVERRTPPDWLMEALGGTPEHVFVVENEREIRICANPAAVIALVLGEAPDPDNENVQRQLLAAVADPGTRVSVGDSLVTFTPVLGAERG